MKKQIKRFSKSTLAVVLSLCLLVSCAVVAINAANVYSAGSDAASVGANAGSAAVGADAGESVGAGPYTIYMIPKSDMANAGTTYRLNYKNTDNTWGQASFSFTGRTYGGRPVYSTSFSPATSSSYNCQLQVGTGGSFSWDLYAGSHAWSDWHGKYFDASGSGSWNNSITFDTYKLRNGTTDVGTLSWNSTSSKYVLTNQSLTGGTGYKFNVYNSSYGRNSKYFQCTAKTQTSSGSTNLYHYNNRSDTAVVTVTPVITSTFSFEWTLADSQNDDQKELVKNGSLNITFPTIYTVTYAANGHGTAPSAVKVQSGGKVSNPGTLTASGWTHDGKWYKESGCTNEWNFSSDTVTSDKTLYAKWTQNATPLTKPEISFTNATVTAGPSTNATLTVTNHDTIKGQDSGVTYELYKGGNKVTAGANTYSYSNGVFTIPARSSNGGTYTVKAIHNSASYSDSSVSDGAALTVNKQTVAKPTITISASDISSGSNATITVTNANAYTNYTLKLYKSSTQQSNTFTNGETTVSTAGTYKVKAISSNSEYYADSADSDTVTLTVSTASWYLLGGIISGGSWDPNTTAANKIGDYVEKDIFCKTVTVSSVPTYFGVCDGTDRWQPKDATYDSAYDVTGCQTKETAKELEKKSEGSFKISTAGTYCIYINQNTKKVWVTQNTWQVTTTARVKTYNLSTGSYNTVANATSSHGTASPASVSVTKGQSTTLTATAQSGYSFVGWYTNADCTTAATGSYTSASYTATPSANTDYYALFKQNEPSKVSITPATVSGATVSVTWNNTTKSNGTALTGVPVGATVNVTVTAASGKYVSGVSTTPSRTLSPAFAAADSYTGSFIVSAATTVNATVADKLKVNCSTNKASWGTVSTNKEYARPGESVTITVTPASGNIKKVTVKKTADGTTYQEWTYSNGAFTLTSGTGALAADAYAVARKSALEAVGASVDIPVGDSTLSFNMPSYATTVVATYEEYSAASEWYYNGFDTSGNSVSGYYHKQMTETKVNGVAYSYYEVTGRGGSGYDQVFDIAKGSATTGTRKVYFTTNGDTYGDWNEPYGTNPTAYFFNSSGKVGTDWPGAEMTYRTEGSAGNNKNWFIEIPDGATGVIFTNHKSGDAFKQTVDLSLTNVGAYYPSGYDDGQKKYTCSTWASPPSDAGLPPITEYYWDNAQYTDQWWTGGFDTQNANSKKYAKPHNGTNNVDFDACKDDYYIVVLYPNTTYTFSVPGHENHQQTTDSTKPMVLWMSELPGQTSTDIPTVKVYAKDGAIRRDGDLPERNDRTYSTFEQHANTYIYGDASYTNHIGTRSSKDGMTSEGSTGFNGYTYDYIPKFNKGETLYIKTNIDADLKETHYLAAYCINGKSYKLHTEAESATGSVTEAFTVPEDWDDKYVEITPIYFMKGNNNLTFYVEGYDQTVMDAGWGNTPGVYPFYQDDDNNYVSNVKNAFGGYPGQPMVFYQGNYYIQLPKSVQTTIGTGSQVKTCYLKGVTLGNNFWDDIHHLTGEVTEHLQTYDFDDLYKIYNEYPTQADHIICSFKYRKAYNNGEPSSFTSGSSEGTYKNGWEVLTDYYGRPVDVFGNLVYGNSATPSNVQAAIDEKDPATKTALSIALKNSGNENLVHVISQDYKSNSAGSFGTEWAIYNTDGTKVVKTGNNAKTTIVPSALAIQTSSHFDNYDAQTRAFQGIYDSLKADSKVVGKLTIITFEQSIAGGSNYADRCDARWYYSKTGESITAKTMIEYTDDGKNWIKDEFTSSTGTGATTGAKAYFLGRSAKGAADPDTASDTTGVSGKNTTSLTGTTGGGYYVFDAENGSQYEFVGWYLLRDNYQNISVRSSYSDEATEFKSHAEQAKNGDIFVARFKKTANGSFSIYHELHPQTSGYGNVYVKADVKNAGGSVVHTYGSITTSPTSSVTIPQGSGYISSGNGYKIEATFKAAAYPTSTFTAFYATVSELLAGYQEDCDYIDSVTITGDTAVVVYDVDKFFSYSSGSPVQTVSNVTHYSKFSLRDDIEYSLTYKFNTRYYGPKLYNKSGVYTESELKSYFNDQITDPNCNYIQLTKQFVQSKAPYETNYREDLTWVIESVEINDGVSSGAEHHNTHGFLEASQVPRTWAKAVVYDFHNDGTTYTKRMAAPYDKLFKKAVEERPDSDAAAAQMAAEWGDPEFEDLYDQGRWTYTEEGVTKQIYIDHWDIYQLDSFTYKKNNDGTPKLTADGVNLDVDTGKSTLVAQTYSARFNYIGYEDYAIVPVYSKTFVDRQAESDGRTDSAATLVTITRNHWNNTISGNNDTGDEQYAKPGRQGTYYGTADTDYDRVYIDFMLNYNYSITVDGKQQNTMLSTTGDNIKVGFVVRSYTVDGDTRVYRGKSQTVLVDKSKIDNKNRLEYCYGFKNNQNNAQSGLYYEFTPFIVDTSQGSTSGAGAAITLPNGGGTYNALYAVEPGNELSGVSFYMIGKSDTTWGSNT